MIANKRVPNYKLEPLIRDCQTFTNYNKTIVADYNDKGEYEIYHWETLILTYNTAEKKIVFLNTKNFSQTTSNLLGKIIRALPIEATITYIIDPEKLVSAYNKRRLARMSWGRIDQTILF